MKIVLKSSSEKDKNPDKPRDKPEGAEKKPPPKNKNVLDRAFSLGDDASDSTAEADGRHLLSKSSSDTSKLASDQAPGKPRRSKPFASLDEAAPDPALDPQLYMYDEFVAESKPEESRSFTYLGFVDEAKKEAAAKGPAEPPNAAESKYMAKMVSTAKKRQMERDIAFEKQLLKEELKSGSEVGEVFVTGAYKKKLEERKRFEEEQRKQDEYDEQHSKNSLTRLHTYLLNQGLAKRTSGAS